MVQQLVGGILPGNLNLPVRFGSAVNQVAEGLTRAVADLAIVATANITVNVENLDLAGVGLAER